MKQFFIDLYQCIYLYAAHEHCTRQHISEYFITKSLLYLYIILNMWLSCCYISFIWFIAMPDVKVEEYFTGLLNPCY